MNLKTYQAATMAEALAEVKRDLGRDAVILHTRSLRKGGLWGIGGRSLWEVTASPNINVPRRVSSGQYAPVGATAVADEPAVRRPDKIPLSVVTAEGSPGASREAYLDSQVNDIRRMVQSLLARAETEPTAPSAVPQELEDFRRHLLEQDVVGEIAEDITRQLSLSLTGHQVGDKELVREEMRKLMVSRIHTAGADADSMPQGRAKIIALIGPTGVGKTTTIAKLAANHKLREGRKVGLITIDTYRIAAVDQLRTYAEIIEVPLRPVLTAGELHQAVYAMRDMDVVLIDTAGRSQNNTLRLHQLRTFLAAAQADEVHLVLSATGGRKCTQAALEQFVPLGANRLVVTKLDEAGAFGVFLNAFAAGGGPLSYVTTGQDVPDDIAPADAGQLAECILAGRFGGKGNVA